MKAKTSPTAADLAQLDAYHAQVRGHLDRLAALASRVENGQLDAETSAEACAVEAFFSGSMQAHHRVEETGVFPFLLASDDTELVDVVRTLQQDHGWMEQNWIELAPQLRAIAQGNSWIDPAEFMHGTDVFLELSYGHSALEEAVVYPHAQAARDGRAARQVAGTPG
ncbi:MAG: hemerythrin domain-containing protein [Burkholderiales bacterium]|jgi:iron-sulfur cluster repair protein YtfE (RIC family)|nr:hemerythrin domain-containing protein [Burkholderiales bacterium]